MVAAGHEKHVLPAALGVGTHHMGAGQGGKGRCHEAGIVREQEIVDLIAKHATHRCNGATVIALVNGSVHGGCLRIVDIVATAHVQRNSSPSGIDAVGPGLCGGPEGFQGLEAFAQQRLTSGKIKGALKIAFEPNMLPAKFEKLRVEMEVRLDICAIGRLRRAAPEPPSDARGKGATWRSWQRANADVLWHTQLIKLVGPSRIGCKGRKVEGDPGLPMASKAQPGRVLKHLVAQTADQANGNRQGSHANGLEGSRKSLRTRQSKYCPK